MGDSSTYRSRLFALVLVHANRTIAHLVQPHNSFSLAFDIYPRFTYLVFVIQSCGWQRRNKCRKLVTVQIFFIIFWANSLAPGARLSNRRRTGSSLPGEAFRRRRRQPSPAPRRIPCPFDARHGVAINFDDLRRSFLVVCNGRPESSARLS